MYLAWRVAVGSEMLDKAIGLGKALTAHPHVVFGEDGKLSRMVAWSWQRYVVAWV